MNFFQVVVYAGVHAMSQFLPISLKAHQLLVPDLTGWPSPSPSLNSIFTIATSLALLVYFRHEWVSLLSGFLQTLIFRKKPMTLDERLPFFLLTSYFPYAITSYYFKNQVDQFHWSLSKVVWILAIAGIPLWIFDYFNCKKKETFDWKWTDALFVGIIQSTALFPGWDPLSAILTATAILNYKREPALKYAYFSLMIPLTWESIHLISNLSAPTLFVHYSWIFLITAFLTSFLSSLLFIGGLMKHIQGQGLGSYLFYRWIFAFGTWFSVWLQSR